MKLKIKEMRKNLHISQAEFADKVGASLRSVSAWERGETIPDAEKIWNSVHSQRRSWLVR